jgi:hypothetical protein
MENCVLFSSVFLKIRLDFFELVGIQVKFIDFVQYVSPAVLINSISRWKIHLVFERGVGM